MEPNMRQTWAQNSPYIVRTDPCNGELNVNLDKDITVGFNEAMNTSTVTYSCDPMPSGGFSIYWDAYNKNATFSHTTDFEKGTTYEFNITAGTDLDDNPLVQGSIPNPWNFTTIEDSPIIIETTPANGRTEVYTQADIIVRFSEPMNKSTVQFMCTPDPGGWQTPVWNALSEEVNFKHTNPFNNKTKYTFEIIAGKDLEGSDLISGPIPNPWSFTTAGEPPMIIETQPKDGAMNVMLDADIIVDFSKHMDIGTVQYSCTPTVTGGFIPEWNLDKTEVKFEHATDFIKNTIYTFKITSAKDLDGYDLISGIIPNPWNFRTIGDHPKIESTYPANEDTGVALDADIIVEFNKPMQTSSVTYTSTPSPAGGFTLTWNTEGDTVNFKHTAEFIKDMAYTFGITSAKDTAGIDLVEGTVPNPWSFRTVGDEPMIFSTDPKNDEVGVELNRKIMIEFNEPMDTASIQYTVTSASGNPGGWAANWNENHEILTLDHNPFTEITRYKFEVTAGRDKDGKGLIPGAVPNPFEFTTGTGVVTGDLTSTLTAPSKDSTLDTLKPTFAWKASENAVEFYLYIDSNKLMVENLDDNCEVVVTVTTTSYELTNVLEAETTYYWTVIPSDGTDDGECLSGVWSFNTPGKDSLKLTTNLESPLNDVNVDTLRPTLTWESIGDGMIYYIYLGKDKNEVINHDKSLERITQEPTYIPMGNLDPNTTYYWTVIPSDGTDYGTSDVWSFTTPSDEKVPEYDDKEKEAIDWGLWIPIIMMVIVLLILIILIILAWIMFKKKQKLPPPEEPRIPWNHRYQ
jgi:methionine-rich copper-binding protein CopC